MFYLLSFIFASALDQYQVMKKDKIHSAWEPDFSSGSTCHIVQGYYSSSEKSQTLNLTTTNADITEATLTIYSLSNIEINPPTKTLSVSKEQSQEFLIEYKCTDSNSGWHEIILDITYSGKKKTANWMKYCGNDEDSFDISLLILMIVAIIVVWVSSYSARDISSLQAHIQDEAEVLTTSHAVGFIVIGSVFLILLFFFMTYLSIVLEVLVCIGGTGAMVSVIAEFKLERYYPQTLTLPYFGLLQITTILSSILALGIILSYVFTKNWILSNIIGLCFAFIIIKTVKIPNFKVGGLLLGLAFFYDIFWVFFSSKIFGDNVMVAVASGLDLPIKLEFPHFIASSLPNSCSMLGLGDLALPGLFLAFASRFDHINSTKYLNVLISCYSLALGLCIFVLVVFNYPQPALLYISPLLIIGMLLYAYTRGEVYQIWKGISALPLINYEFPMEELRSK